MNECILSHLREREKRARALARPAARAVSRSRSTAYTRTAYGYARWVSSPLGWRHTGGGVAHHIHSNTTTPQINSHTHTHTHTHTQRPYTCEKRARQEQARWWAFLARRSTRTISCGTSDGEVGVSQRGRQAARHATRVEGELHQGRCLPASPPLRCSVLLRPSSINLLRKRPCRRLSSCCRCRRHR
jgi:hypothetical protein